MNQRRQYVLIYWDNSYENIRDIGIEVNGEIFTPLHLQGTKLIFKYRVSIKL